MDFRFAFRKSVGEYPNIDEQLPEDWAAKMGEQHGRLDEAHRMLNGLPPSRGFGIAKTEAEARASNQIWFPNLRR